MADADARIPTPPRSPGVQLTEGEGDGEDSAMSPRKLSRLKYAQAIGDGREYVLSKMDPRLKPKQAHLVSAILERDPSRKPKNWTAQDCSTWLHSNPAVPKVICKYYIPIFYLSI